MEAAKEIAIKKLESAMRECVKAGIEIKIVPFYPMNSESTRLFLFFDRLIIFNTAHGIDNVELILVKKINTEEKNAIS